MLHKSNLKPAKMEDGNYECRDGKVRLIQNVNGCPIIFGHTHVISDDGRAISQVGHDPNLDLIKKVD